MTAIKKMARPRPRTIAKKTEPTPSLPFPADALGLSVLSGLTVLLRLGLSWDAREAARPTSCAKQSGNEGLVIAQI